MDESEYDIYDDLDVLKGNEKPQKEVIFILFFGFIKLFGATKDTFPTLSTLVFSIIYSFIFSVKAVPNYASS